ncbi:MAG: hypothetical protein V1875_01685 [Candidatus Altiarchaeota archaeon]
MRACVWAISFILVAACAASADIGPKPTVDLEVLYHGERLREAFDARMLSCGVEYAYDHYATPIPKGLNISENDPGRGCIWRPDALAWGGRCRDGLCQFDYHPPEEFKLAVYVPSMNRTFVSRATQRKNFRSAYRMELSDSSIREMTPLWDYDIVKNYFKALALTLVFELLTAYSFLAIVRMPMRRILRSVVYANLISLTLVWLWLVAFPQGEESLWGIPFAEAFAVCFEALFIYRYNGGTISAVKSFALSILMNAASLFIGGFFYLMLYGILF